MLGLVLLYFIGKHFYNLAFEYEKHQWTYAILGIVAYYAGTAVAGFVLLFIADDPMRIVEESQVLLGIFAIPFGIFGCYLFHLYLVRKWMTEQQFSNMDDTILDRNFMENETEKNSKDEEDKPS